MKKLESGITRRRFVKTAVAAPAMFHIAPAHLLSAPRQDPPSETLGGALIGVGGRGPGTYKGMCRDLNVKKLAECDVKFKNRADNETIYTDFRRVLERKDIDVVAIATPPHWHALISIAAAQAGKDVLCEKPLTRTIAEGRAVVEAFRRYKRVFQIGTFGRFGQSRNAGSILKHKIMRSGFLNPNPGVVIPKHNWKVKQWSGRLDIEPQPVPSSLDWDLYCGPSPLKPFHPPRRGGTHRGYWDYEGGGMADMGQHRLDPFQWTYGKDDTSPVEIEAFAPPAHPEVCSMWAWVEMKYADGLTLVLDSGEWGDPYGKKAPRDIRLEDLKPEYQEKIKATPDPKPLLTFAQAVRSRGQAGGHAEAAHRCATLLHLANLAIRTGRKLKFDPVKEEIIGDDEANRLVNPPMRAPWHL